MTDVLINVGLTEDQKAAFEAMLEGFEESANKEGMNGLHETIKSKKEYLKEQHSAYNNANNIGYEWISKNASSPDYKANVVEGAIEKIKADIAQSIADAEDSIDTADKTKKFLVNFSRASGALGVAITFEEIYEAVDEGDTQEVARLFAKAAVVSATSYIAGALGSLVATGFASLFAAGLASSLLLAAVPVIAVGVAAYIVADMFDEATKKEGGKYAHYFSGFDSPSSVMQMTFGSDVKAVEFTRDLMVDHAGFSYEGVNELVESGIEFDSVQSAALDFNSVEGKTLGDEKRDVIEGTDILLDKLYGMDGDDYLRGLKGFDFLDGGDGSDTLEGGDDADTLLGQKGNDVLDGGAGYDELAGGEGTDLLLGGNGNDILEGGEGNDLLKGGADNDTYIFSGNFGRDTIIDTEGSNTLIIDDAVGELKQISEDSIIYRNSANTVEAVVVDNGINKTLLVNSLANNGSSITLDNWSEGQFGISLAVADQEEPVSLPVIAGDAGANALSADFASDYAALVYVPPVSLQGGDGRDYIEGSWGGDRIYGDGGDDWIDAGSVYKYSQFTPPEADAPKYSDHGKDVIEGGDGNDVITGRSAQSRWSGGNGNDMLLANTALRFDFMLTPYSN